MQTALKITVHVLDLVNVVNAAAGVETKSRTRHTQDLACSQYTRYQFQNYYTLQHCVARVSREQFNGSRDTSINVLLSFSLLITPRTCRWRRKTRRECNSSSWQPRDIPRPPLNFDSTCALCLTNAHS